MKTPVYLDHNATTPVDPTVLDAMLPFFREEFGNAASRTHAFGWRAEAAVEQAREQLAAALGASPEEIVFTSGATESNNLALKGLVAARAGRGEHVVTTCIEHSAVLDPCAWLESRGTRITRLPVDRLGRVDPDRVAAALDDRTVLVSVMAANNEIGTLEPLAEIGRHCTARGIPFHTDAAQALGKIPVDVESWQVDLLSVSAHKLYGPKGVGALYVRRRRPRLRLEPLFHGGGHERGLRSGTLPVPLVVGLGAAAAKAVEGLREEAERLASLRDALLARLRDALDGVHRNGDPERGLPGTLHLSFDGVEADALVAGLRRLAISTGSACSSATPEPSHVLRALGLEEARVRGGVRIGIGRFTTREEIAFAAEALVEEVERLRRQAPRRPRTQPAA